MNEMLKAIERRYTCRAYADTKIPDEDLRAIAQAAIQSPSAMNRQNWQVVFVKDPGLLQDLEEAGMEVLANLDDKAMYERIQGRGGKVYYNAPCMVYITVKQESDSNYDLIDCGILAENIALAAASLGINSTHCGLAALPLGGPRSAEFIEQLQFPEGYGFGLAVLLGYEVQPGTPHEPDQGKITWIG